MKKFTLLSLLSLATIMVMAQSPKKEASYKISGGEVSVVYCSPFAKGRTIMGDLVPYGKVWRTGANAATIVEFEKDVKFQGKDLAAGKYSLYTIPGEKEWTIIVNSATGQWGTKYSKGTDVLRVTAKAGKTDSFKESFAIDITKKGMDLSWENTMVSVAIK